MDFGGYKFASQGGALKVSKGVLVVLKDTKIENLYKMEESTQINGAIMISGEENKSTHLWHQQPGHISEKRIMVPINQKSLLDLKSLYLNFCKHCAFGK